MKNAINETDVIIVVVGEEFDGIGLDQFNLQLTRIVIINLNQNNKNNKLS